MADLSRRVEDGPTAGAGPSRVRTLLGWLCLAGLALTLVLGGYYRPVLREGPRHWPVSGDASFYAYQFSRMGELNGRWWELGRDDRVGAPYQPEFGKHPGIFEGVDLLLVSSLTSRWLEPALNYHVLMIAVLVVNALIIGGVVRRLTGSWGWAVLGVVLVTWNFSTAFRLQGHSHLFKYGWTVLAVLAFSRYLDRPSIRSGMALGLALSLVLQGSFYLGFFLCLVLAAWWFGCLVRGTLTRAHPAPTIVAGLSLAAVGALLTFPVWRPEPGRLLADAYQGHSRIDAWSCSAELWQYFVTPASGVARLYLADFNDRVKSPRSFHEGWHYPGLTVLLASAAYAAWRLRGRTLPVSDPRLLDRLMGLTALLVLLSLAGGPSFFLLSGIGCFRAYGRAGLLAVALWCVATPVILHSLARMARRPIVGHSALAMCLGLALYEGFEATKWYPPQRTEIPPWVDWLARQPRDTRLAAFPPMHDGAPAGGFDDLLYRIMHRHACFNGAEQILLEADLKLLGASYARMNPAGLRFIASLGYDTLAFHQDYLAANPWIRSVPWLESVEALGPWTLVRTRPGWERLPTRTLAEVLAAWPAPSAPVEVPADCWITERLDLDHDVVVDTADPLSLAWLDARGRPVGRPTRALFQHVYGPGIPAFAVKAPREPGQYRLAILDRSGRPIRSRPCRVRRDLPTGLEQVAGKSPSLSVASVVVTPRSEGVGPVSLVIENRTSCYLQAHTSRDQVYLPSVRGHATAMRDARGSLGLTLRAPAVHPGGVAVELELPLPCDLPPQGRLFFTLPRDAVPSGNGPIEVTPRFHWANVRRVGPSQAAVAILPGDAGPLQARTDPTEPARR